MKHSRSIAFMLILIYLFPALMDLTVSVIGFVNPIRLAKMGHSAIAVAGAGAIWSLVYMIGCPLVGPRLTPGNSARVVIVACTLMAAVCGLFPFFPALPGIYLLAALGAVASALFFPAFQVFMKAADSAHDKPLTYSTGLYTFAWSFGFAVAPFVSGFFMELGRANPAGEPSGWKYCYAFAGLCALGAAVGFHFVERLKRLRGVAHQDNSADQALITADDHNAAGLPDLAWVGWIAAGTGVVALAMIRNVFPARAVVDLRLNDSTQGLIAFLLYVTQALTGLALITRRRWMYSPSAVALSGLIGVAGTFCFGFLKTPAALCAASVLFGMYSGFFFFYFVYHALCHPVKAARYVGINEAVVGIGGLIGPVAGGMLADRVGYIPTFLAGSGVVAAATVFQVVIHRRNLAT